MSEKESSKVINDKEVLTKTVDLTLSQIKEMFDDGEIIPQPEYQRDYVWKETLASKLIESIIMSIPIPTIYLCEEADETLSIIDGQQRTTSIVKFLKNEYKLKGLEERDDLNGKKFCELDKSIQRKIKNYSLRAIILLKNSQELKYEIFARLNQGAVKLKPQELRNCIYRGSFNDMVNEIALNNKYLPILFIADNSRKEWQENICRFFALSDYSKYSSSINKTINSFLAKHQNDNENEVQEYKKKFTNMIDIVKQVVGDDAFCAYDRVNKKITNKFSGSIYDSIAIPFSFFDSHDLMKHADEIRKEINNLKMNDEQYQDFTYAATGSKDRVIGRIMMVYNLLSKIVGKYASGNIQRAFTDDIKDQLWHDGYICSYCGQTILNKDDAEVDHTLPFIKGGDTTIENAQLLHRHCNREKSDRLGIASFEEDSEEEYSNKV